MPSTTTTSCSNSNSSSSLSATFSTSIEHEVLNNHEETNQSCKGIQQQEQNLNDILMNPLKKLRKIYSVEVLDTDQKIVQRGFITEYYDCGFQYAIHPTIAMHKSKPSKINAVFKDFKAKIKMLCHAKEDDRPSDESHPLYNVPIWPNISDMPDTSSAEWVCWSRKREELADTIVKGLFAAYVVKTAFKGTISAIYNKMTTSK